MSTATVKPPRESHGSGLEVLTQFVGLVHSGQRLLLTDVAWNDYVQLLAWRDAHSLRAVRLTYDHERLEIMVISNLHERLRKVLALLIETWIAETGGEYLPSGQLTHKREDLEHGLEPDECYYIQNWKKVAGLREIDFLTDPPPDLTIEVEVRRSISSRLPINASFKIPEVWRYDGERITIILFDRNDTYHESTVSKAIPAFPFADAPRFLKMAESLEVGFATVAREFRAWIKTSHPTT